ncbi:MAG: hypothetical protein J0L92_22955 [Deltaproteobacteria bacterium]|nr:hypothetical protein [Deltaproteobacteria bacterium]
MTQSHSAPGPLAGYLWQLRRALIELLGLNPGKSITIEKQDDICVVRLCGEVVVAMQAKHSMNSATLTLHSPEVWKTLRVWAAFADKPKSFPESLVLVTTDPLHPDLDAINDKGTLGATADQVRTSLDAIAKAAGNQDLREAYTSWSSLKGHQKVDILVRARIVGGSGKLPDLTGELHQALQRHYIWPEDLSHVSVELDGWFFQTVSKRLGKTGCTISFDEVWTRINDHHRSYRPLVPREPQSTPEEIEKVASDQFATDATFLRQLKLLDANDRALRFAAQAYARARIARDHWLNSAAVGLDHVTEFTTALEDHWNGTHAAASRGLDDTPSADQLRAAGWKVHDDCCIHHRAAFATEAAPPYLTTGSYHQLADLQRVGWHPEYENALKEKP